MAGIHIKTIEKDDNMTCNAPNLLYLVYFFLFLSKFEMIQKSTRLPNTAVYAPHLIIYVYAMPTSHLCRKFEEKVKLERIRRIRHDDLLPILQS